MGAALVEVLRLRRPLLETGSSGDWKRAGACALALAFCGAGWPDVQASGGLLSEPCGRCFG